jgi:hypothetical protein
MRSGRKPLEDFGAHVVDADPLADQVPHSAVDLSTRLAGIDPWLGADRQTAHVLREVALVGDANETVAEPEGADDLGRAGNQGHDGIASGAAVRGVTDEGHGEPLCPMAMIAMPPTATAQPTRSQRLGALFSTSHNHSTVTVT